MVVKFNYVLITYESFFFKPEALFWPILPLNLVPPYMGTEGLTTHTLTGLRGAATILKIEMYV